MGRGQTGPVGTAKHHLRPKPVLFVFLRNERDAFFFGGEEKPRVLVRPLSYFEGPLRRFGRLAVGVSPRGGVFRHTGSLNGK